MRPNKLKSRKSPISTSQFLKSNNYKSKEQWNDLWNSIADESQQTWLKNLDSIRLWLIFKSLVNLLNTFIYSGFYFQSSHDFTVMCIIGFLIYLKGSVLILWIIYVTVLALSIRFCFYLSIINKQGCTAIWKTWN